MTQLNIEDRAHGFEIQRDGAQFRLVDRSTFCNWGTLSNRFVSRDAAEEYARRCEDFKCGRRRTVDLEKWEESRA